VEDRSYANSPLNPSAAKRNADSRAAYKKAFDNLSAAQSVLKWARFAGFPLLALLLLLMVQAKSSRGLKFALGESEVQVEVTGPAA